MDNKVSRTALLYAVTWTYLLTFYGKKKAEETLLLEDESEMLTTHIGMSLAKAKEPHIGIEWFRASKPEQAFFEHFVEKMKAEATKRDRFAYRRLIAYASLQAGRSLKQAAHDVGMTKEWVERLLVQVDKSGIFALRLDRRTSNKSSPKYRIAEAIEFVALNIKGSPPDGDRWKARHVASLLENQFGFQGVKVNRANEILNLAKEFNRKKSG